MSTSKTSLRARLNELPGWVEWILWIGMALFLLAEVSLIKWIWPTAIPYGVFELWQTKGTIVDWLISSWPILAWAGGLTIILSALTRNTKYQNAHAESYLARGLMVSLRAGVMEEIIFRWLLLLTGIVGAKVGDWLLGGFYFQHGLVWVLNEYIVLPVANFATFHMLSDVLMNPATWFIGVAIVTANAKFRDGHKYQGLLGWVNSWFIGMVFFYLLFQYGLLACITVHFTYDALIFTVRYIDRKLEAQRGVSDETAGADEFGEE